MKAADVMTRRVITVRDDATVREAARLMLQDNISGLPVVDRDGRLAGIVTEGDLLRRVETATEIRRPKWLEFLVGSGTLADEYIHSHGRRISEVMTTPVVTVTEDTELDEVLRQMERRHIKRIVVLAGGDKIAGLISRSNIVHALADLMPEQHQTQASDAAIRARIMAEMEGLHWRPNVSINPIVHDAVVDLHGVTHDGREAAALRVLCENVPGVKRVNDRIVWVEPYSGEVIDRTDAPAGDTSAASAGDTSAASPGEKRSG